MLKNESLLNSGRAILVSILSVAFISSLPAQAQMYIPAPSSNTMYSSAFGPAGFTFAQSIRVRIPEQRSESRKNSRLCYDDESGARQKTSKHEWIKQLREVNVALNEYASTHDRFPRCQSEYDEFLKYLYPYANGSVATASSNPVTMGKLRTYCNLAVTEDTTIAALTGAEQPAADWAAQPGTIVVATDGDKNAACWVAGKDGRPLRDPANHEFFVRQTIR